MAMHTLLLAMLGCDVMLADDAKIASHHITQQYQQTLG
jgi:hypothetical protein